MEDVLTIPGESPVLRKPARTGGFLPLPISRGLGRPAGRSGARPSPPAAAPS